MFHRSPTPSVFPQKLEFEYLYLYFLHAYEKLGFIEFSKMLLAYLAIGLFCFAILWCIPLTRNIMVMIYNVIYFIYCVIEITLKGVLFTIRGIFFSGETIVNKCRSIAYKRRIRSENEKREEGRGDAEQSGDDYNSTNDYYQNSSKSIEEKYAEILGVEGVPTAENIKKAFKAAMLKYHPDRVQSLGVEFQEMAKEKSIAINEAYTFFKSRYGI